MKNTFFASTGVLILALPALAQGPSPVLSPQFKGDQTLPKIDPSSPFAMAMALEKMNKTLEKLAAENADLKKRLADVETKSAQATKDLVAFKLLFPSLDKAVGALDSKFAAHQHPTYFSYRSFRWLSDSHKDLQGDFYVPYIWLGNNPKLTQIQKEQAAEKYPGFNKTGKPAP